MEKSITKRISKKGVDITVVINRDKYDVYIDITPKADISKKITCNEFKLKFFLSNGAKKINKTLHLEKKGLKYKKNSPNVFVCLDFKCDEYKCKISIAPQIYVSDDEIAIARRTQEIKRARRKACAKKKKIRINDKYRPGMSVQKSTNYTISNMSRPYFGGRCTPK